MKINYNHMKTVKGLKFEPTYKNSFLAEVDGIMTRVVHKNQLIEAKRASNRPKDNDDLEHLE